MRGLVLPPALLVTMVVASGIGACSESPVDKDHSYACPPPLLLDRVYWEMPTATQDIPLGRRLGHANTAGCKGVSGRRVIVRTILGIPKSTAVATVVDGEAHLYVSDSISPEGRCGIQFVACESSH